MSSPRPTASLAMTPGTDTPYPRAVFGQAAANHDFGAAYIAKVRIAVRAGAIVITREGCGSGSAKAPTPGEAHELALKAAETDATKRALATFGNPFGLALYDRELAGVKNRKALSVSPGPWLLSLPSGAGQSFNRADEFVAALSKALTEATDIELCSPSGNAMSTPFAQSTNRATAPLREASSPTISLRISRGAPSPWQSRMSNRRRTPYRAPNHDQKSTRVPSPLVSPSGFAQRNTSALSPNSHASSVGAPPAHAHHVRYAQPRGLALKVSDEFTVPLCAIHHSANHATGDERRWWQERKIDPLAIAAELWGKSLRLKAMDHQLSERRI